MIEVNLTIESLIHLGKIGKNIACVGAGNGLQSFSKMLEAVGQGFIWKIADNDSDKQGQLLQLAFGEYEIVATNQIMDSDVIVVTCNAYLEIKNQLSKMDFREDVKICYYMSILKQFMLKRIGLRTWEFRISKKPMIPKIIHYCWFGGQKIPKKYQKWMESWEKHCPGYEIVRWDEANYDVSKNRYMQEAYQSGNFGFVSDYARLDIVYEHGGIYLDVDVELVKPLDDFLYEKGFAAFHWHRISTGLGFGTIRHFPVIRKLRDDYEREKYIPFASNLERRKKRIRLCPDIQTESLMELGLIPNGFLFQEIEGLRIYPMPVLCGSGSRMMDISYSVHHFEGSWLNATLPKTGYTCFKIINDIFSRMSCSPKSGWAA